VNEPSVQRPLRSVICERHGLRFDPSVHDGCVRCRREAATSPDAAVPAAGAAAEPPVGRAWAWAAVLWLVAGGALYLAHRQVVASFAGWQLAADVAFGEPAAIEEPELDPQMQQVLDELEALRDEEGASDDGEPLGSPY
jgi:hypothetical protein